MAQGNQSNEIKANFNERLKQMSSKEAAMATAGAMMCAAALYAMGGAMEQALSGVLALASLVLGGFAMWRLNVEIRTLRMLELNATPERLSNMSHGDFVAFVHHLFRSQGYLLFDAPYALRQRGMADFVAQKKRTKVLVQLGHWDDNHVDLREIQALFNTASTLNGITKICVVSLGAFAADTAQWCARRGVELLGIRQLLEMAAVVLEQDTVQQVASSGNVDEVREEFQHEISDLAHGQRRFLFVDFAGMSDGYEQLERVMIEHPAYDLIATTMPADLDLAAIASRMPMVAARLRGELPQHGNGRYFDILSFLDNRPGGRQTPWAVLESQPRLFPEGCTELVAINPDIPFDHHAATRLTDALLAIDRIAERERNKGAST
ncbi:MAG: restriction endonuclease [Dechloromonas sp.]|nr:restriction endonuclease [Dechloromonas sp.]